MSFDLAILDAVMPGMSGVALTEALAEAAPELKLLYCTGYDPGVFGEGYFDDPSHRLLRKPYTRSDFLEAVREVLDNP